MSVLVCVIQCYQPSPNTPPQTHISHFGMMTLPVLAFLIMILKLCSGHNVTLSPFSFFFSFFLCYSTLPIPPPPLSSCPSSLCVSPTPPPLSFQSVTPPSSHSFHAFIPHTFHSLPRSMWGLHSPRQCWVRLPQRHPERRMLRRFRTATASSPWDARYTSSTTLQLSSSGSIRSVSAAAMPPTYLACCCRCQC